MKILLSTLFIAFMAIGFAGCSRQQPATKTTEPGTAEVDSAAKVGQTTKTGSVSKLNNKYYLNQTGQPILEIDSYLINLSEYEGKTVTVTGEYSGNTLFVGAIQ